MAKGEDEQVHEIEMKIENALDYPDARARRIILANEYVRMTFVGQ